MGFLEQNAPANFRLRLGTRYFRIAVFRTASPRPKDCSEINPFPTPRRGVAERAYWRTGGGLTGDRGRYAGPVEGMGSVQVEGDIAGKVGGGGAV
ncbi:hypothetical protein Mapa_000163 [Marchantia paleacea]|nr:hypothetical protein Mapa_000163 [Marchantia paleacea]